MSLYIPKMANLNSFWSLVLNKKVIIVGPSTLMNGGVSSVISELTAGFKKLKVDYEVISTTINKNFFYKLIYFLIAVYRVICFKFNGLENIFHLHLSSRTSTRRKVLIILLIRLLKMKYFIHLHGAEYVNYFYNEEHTFIKKLIKYSFNNAEKVIVLSNSWKCWVDDTFNNCNSVVVHNGVTSMYRDRKSKRAKSILYLGEVCERKGFGDLLVAFEGVRKNSPDAVLNVVGGGDIDYYTKSDSYSFENVNFCGWKCKDEIATYYNNNQIYCLPSYNEGLPMTILEAMSAGMVIISTPVGGIPEAISDKQTGLLINPGDISGLEAAITDIFEDERLSTLLSDNSISKYQSNFSNESMTNNIIKVLGIINEKD